MSDHDSGQSDPGEARQVSAHTVLLDRGEMARYVAHREGHEWLFGGPDWLDEGEERFGRVPLDRLIKLDATLTETLDLAIGWHAWRDDPADAWQRARIPSGRTFLITYDARATVAKAEREGVAGAYVNCWFKTRWRSSGRRRARREVEREDWVIIDTLVDHEITEADELSAQAEQFYRQVQVDGLVLVCYRYPPEADAEATTPLP